LSKYRNRVEIVADILNIVENGARKTQIMYKGNLSYKLLTRYLGEVIGAGLVCAGEKTGLYQLTEKGKMFLKHFENYSKSRNVAEQNLSNMKTLKAKLEKMCVAKASSSVSSHSEDEERNPS
jgi:predicted transcriptional regulator